MAMPDGRIGHAELALGEAVVMLASEWPAGGVMSAKRLPFVHSQFYVQVDDVDAHFARARSQGATIATEPGDQDYGERSYRAIDPEGQRWHWPIRRGVGSSRCCDAGPAAPESSRPRPA
jgi:PhnB protein